MTAPDMFSPTEHHKCLSQRIPPVQRHPRPNRLNNRTGQHGNALIRHNPEWHISTIERRKKNMVGAHRLELWTDGL